MPTQVHISSSSDELAAAFALFFQERLKGKDRFTVALSGGSTPKLLFKLWADQYRERIEWSKVHFFWGDERCVPPEHADSNFGVCKALLLDHIDIPAENIHRIHGEVEAEMEAKRYGEEIAHHASPLNGIPSFDLVILGMGDDGHTASIFPHQIAFIDSEDYCVVATHPDTGQNRITITGSVINNAETVVFLVSGGNKREKVRAILQKENGYESYPAAHVRPKTGELYWFVDKEAMH